MGLTHGNVIFDILEPSAFQKYSICWVFEAFFCSTFFTCYFAIQPRPALTAVSECPLGLGEISWEEVDFKIKTRTVGIG